jgi:biotin operon repressor
MKIKDISSSALSASRVEIKALLTKTPMSEAELGEELHIAQSTVARLLDELRQSGANVTRTPNGKFFLHGFIERGGQLVLKTRADGWTKIGFVTDNHLCNKHERLDVLNVAYDTFVEEGVTDVLNAGNWVEGEARFNRQELVVAPGIDPQLEYWIDRYPQRKGITTHYVSGDDHEGWWIQRECINVGQYAQSKAEKAGRNDLKYLGHVEADIELQSGKGSAVGRLMHPGGGSAYALSYAPQKLVESFQGGEKPAILFIGHYHKWDYCFPREVHCISGGCTVDQTAFLRKNKIGAHVGFSIVRFKQDSKDGHITRLGVEWVPFYDLGYYEKRFG